MALFRKLVIMLSVVGLEIFFNGLGVESTLGSDFLDQKEVQLKQIAKAMQDNAARECELLKTCTPELCTRHTCKPREGDGRNPFLCLRVKNSKYCKAQDGNSTCQWKKFDYTRSYVRTANTTDLNSLGTILATCAQRELDPFFMNISKPDSLTRVYVGLNDGAWRAFPGSDQKAEECGEFETRTRPWYRESTSVTKVVAILIDAGLSMSSPLKIKGAQGTILNAAKNITEEFLKTFNVKDNVNIIMFNSTHATPLSPSMVTLKDPSNIADTTSHPELDPLRRNLRQQNTGTSQTASNVTMGINLALSQFGTNYPLAVKIIIILSDGNFATANDVAIPTSNITASNVKMFVYTIYQSENALLLGNTSFGHQLCSVKGNFEVISRDLGNAILALNSVVSFTAGLHASVANYTADYSVIYPEYDQINGDIITVSRSVFGVNRKLLGVAGITIYINELGNLTGQVESARVAKVGKPYNPANFVLSNENCSIQTAWPESEPCGEGVSIPPDGGFCPKTDMTSSIQELTCCGDCIKPAPVPVPAPRSKSRDANSTPEIIIIIAVSVGGVAMIAFCLLLCFYIRRGGRTRSSPDHSENLVFPGDMSQAQQADNHREADKTPATH